MTLIAVPVPAGGLGTGSGYPQGRLCKWVREIVQSSPAAARLTLLEVIVGALLASGDHVTQAILALTPRLGWQASGRPFR